MQFVLRFAQKFETAQNVVLHELHELHAATIMFTLVCFVIFGFISTFVCVVPGVACACAGRPLERLSRSPVATSWMRCALLDCVLTSDKQMNVCGPSGRARRLLSPWFLFFETLVCLRHLYPKQPSCCCPSQRCAPYNRLISLLLVSLYPLPDTTGGSAKTSFYFGFDRLTVLS